MPTPPDSATPELVHAAKALKNGELVAFPTDTFFALGADALNPAAVKSVFRAKGRNPGTPVPVLISDAAMVEELVRDFAGVLRDLTDHFWPGALTVVLPASDVVPEIVIAGTGTIGLRIPDHDLARQLIELANTPLTGTSCNITGQPPTRDANVVKQQMGNLIAACIDAACGENTLPSTVVGFENAASVKLKVLRAGAIGVESIRNVVGDILVN
jgi:L-threonylcarbamoyladenylate synthase